ncbi:MAG: hypothetical protein ABL994_14635, partial [Verrucomicrobiales bacterium]
SSGGGGESSGGGGESSGGGGESSGGGGESSGGGGESSGGGGPIYAGKDFYFVSDTSGNIAGLVNYDELVKEVEDPNSWRKRQTMIGGLFSLIRGTKGVDAIIKYRHGVFTEGKEHIYRVGDKPIVNLHDFYLNYSAGANRDAFKQEFSLTAMPKALELHRNDTPGIFGDLYLLKFKPSDKLDPRVFHPEVVGYNQINAPELAALLLHNMWQGAISGKTVDAVSVREWLSPGGAISAATFEVVDGYVTVSAIIPRFARVVLRFPGEFIAKGTSFHQYVGPIDVSSFGPVDADHETRIRYHGVANLEWDPHSNRWEFKIVMAGRVPPALVQTRDIESPEGKLFSNQEEIAFQVFSLPLRTPANEALSELEIKPWEWQQMELGLSKRNELAKNRQEGFDVAWTAASEKSEELVAIFPFPPVDLTLTRSMNDYLMAFDRKFERPKSLAPEDFVCREADLSLRMREAEKRMGLNMDLILQESVTRVPRELAVRVQMLEQQQMMNDIAIMNLERNKSLRDSVKTAVDQSGKLLNKVGKLTLPVPEGLYDFSHSVLKVMAPFSDEPKPVRPVASDPHPR